MKKSFTNATMSDPHKRVDVKNVLDLFFEEHNLPHTLTRLINHNKMFMRDPVFEISCMCMTNSLCVSLMDKGIGFFVNDLSICLPYKTLVAAEIDAISQLLLASLQDKSYYLQQQRCGGLCIRFTISSSCMVISHKNFLCTLYDIILKSNMAANTCKQHIANIIFQRLDRAIHVDKQALCAVHAYVRQNSLPLN